jgi:hypothetical protein
MKGSTSRAIDLSQAGKKKKHQEASRRAQLPDEQTPVKGREVTDKLLASLLADPEFLRLPMSEMALAKALNKKQGPQVKASPLREAIIGFVLQGWLTRTDRGVCRRELNVVDLVQLFGVRLAIERAAVRRINAYSSQSRKLIAARLRAIVQSQAQLHDNLEHDPGNQEARVAWFRKSVEFHVAIATEADYSCFARRLESTIYEVRIGVCAPLEEPEIRANTVQQHGMVADSIEVDRYPETKFIEDHIKQPMLRALERKLPKLDNLKKEVEDYWNQARELFAPSPRLAQCARRRHSA